MHPAGSADPTQVQSRIGLFYYHSHSPPTQAPGVPGPIPAAKDRGEPGIKQLCLVYVAICEASILIVQQTSAVSGPPFAVNNMAQKL